MDHSLLLANVSQLLSVWLPLRAATSCSVLDSKDQIVLTVLLFVLWLWAKISPLSHIRTTISYGSLNISNSTNQTKTRVRDIQSKIWNHYGMVIVPAAWRSFCGKMWNLGIFFYTNYGKRTFPLEQSSQNFTSMPPG